MLQALALGVPAEEWGQALALPKDIQLAFEVAQSLGDGFHIRRNAEIETIKDQEEFNLRAIQERLRLHTQIVRNWGYFSDVVAIATELHSPFDEALRAKFGLSATEIVKLFVPMMRTVEARSNERFRMLQRVLRERKPKKMLRAYYKQNPHIVGSAEDLIKELGSRIHERDELKFIILSHSDLLLTDIMTVNAKQMAEATGLDADAVDAVLKRLSLSPGDLKDANPEHLFMANPIWLKPLVRLSDDATLCPLAQVFFGFVHEIMDSLIGDVGKTTELEERRAKFLEAEVERLSRESLPDAKIVAGYKWQSEGKGYETDLVAALGSYVLIVESKSGMVTAPALRGAKDRAKRHVEDLLLHPSEQSLRLKALLQKAKGGDKDALDQVNGLGFDLAKMENILRVSVTLTDFNVLSSQELIFKSIGWLDKDHDLAVNMNVADFRCVLDLLKPPPLLFDYLANRDRLQRTHEMDGDELDWLGFYLGTGFNIGQTEGEIRGIHITGMSQKVDAYYNGRDAGLNLPKPKLRLTNLWEETLEYLARRKFDGWLDCAVALLQSASYDEQRAIEREFTKVCQRVPQVWRQADHINSVVVIPPSMRSTAVVHFAFPPQLADKRHEMAENLASHGWAENEHIIKTVVFGRQVNGRVGPVSYVAVFLRPIKQ